MKPLFCALGKPFGAPQELNSPVPQTWCAMDRNSMSVWLNARKAAASAEAELQGGIDRTERTMCKLQSCNYFGG